jgi:hypothetical protein
MQPSAAGVHSVRGKRLAVGSIQQVRGDLSSGAKRPVSESDHSPASNAEVKNKEVHLHFPIRLYVVLLNLLRARSTLHLSSPLLLPGAGIAQ